MRSVKLVRDNATGLGTTRQGQRNEWMKIRRVREDGFVQKSNRKTFKRLENATEMTSASRFNKYDVLNLTERGLEVEEVNAVDVVYEIVQINVGSGLAKSLSPIRNLVLRNVGDEDGELGSCKWHFDTCGKETRGWNPSEVAGSATWSSSCIFMWRRNARRLWTQHGEVG